MELYKYTYNYTNDNKAVDFTQAQLNDFDEMKYKIGSESNISENIINEIALISNENTEIDQFIQSLQFIAEQSKLSDACIYLFENDVHQILYSRIKESTKFSNPFIITLFLIIMNNILTLTNKLLPILMSEFQQILYNIVNRYSCGPPQVVHIIFDTFLVLMKPNTHISLFLYYIQFFKEYLKVPNPCIDPDLTKKSFQCCNRMFEIPHDGLLKCMLENDFVYDCCIHMNRKTPSFFEACQLMGNIANLNRYLIDHLPDEFFTELMSDLLEDPDDKIVSAALKVCQSFTSIVSLRELLIDEKPIFTKILKCGERNFNVKQCSIELLTALMESKSTNLENNIEEYGTLDFFVDYIETGDIEMIGHVLSALQYLICHFVENYLSKSKIPNYQPPFVSVLLNSSTLYQSITDLRFSTDTYNDDIQEATYIVYDLFSKYVK